MNKNQLDSLQKIGVTINTVKYSYPNPELLAEYGFWNTDQFPERIQFSVNGSIDSPETARHIEQSLLILVKAMQSGDPSVTEMLEEMLGQIDTLLGLKQ